MRHLTHSGEIMKKIWIMAFWVCTLAAFTKQSFALTGIVVSQDIESYQQGRAAVPVGNSLILAPIMRRSNVVVIDTPKARFTLVEESRKFIVLPVDGTVDFYQSGNKFVILDSGRKKHKFSLLHMQLIQ